MRGLIGEGALQEVLVAEGNRYVKGVRNGLDVGKFAELVRADEREACAKVCDGIMQYYKTNTTLNTEQNLIGYMAAEVCGVRIRERG